MELTAAGIVPRCRKKTLRRDDANDGRAAAPVLSRPQSVPARDCVTLLTKTQSPAPRDTRNLRYTARTAPGAEVRPCAGLSIFGKLAGSAVHVRLQFAKHPQAVSKGGFIVE